MARTLNKKSILWRKACFSGLPPEDAFINTAFYLYSLSASLSLFLSASPQFFQTCDSEHQLPACFIPAALPLQNSFLFFSAGLLQPLIFPSFWPPCAPLPAQRAFFFASSRRLIIVSTPASSANFTVFTANTEPSSDFLILIFPFTNPCSGQTARQK